MARSVDASSYDPMVLARLVKHEVQEPHAPSQEQQRVEEVVATILSVLHDLDREVVELCLMAGISQRDACQQLGITRGALRRSLERSIPLIEGLCGLLDIAPPENSHE